MHPGQKIIVAVETPDNGTKLLDLSWTSSAYPLKTILWPFYLTPLLCYHEAYLFCSYPWHNIYSDLEYKPISYVGVSSCDWITKSHLTHKHEYHGNASTQKNLLGFICRKHSLKRKCQHFDGFLSLKVVKITNFSAASDENFIKMETFTFNCFKNKCRTGNMLLKIMWSHNVPLTPCSCPWYILCGFILNMSTFSASHNVWKRCTRDQW